MQTLPWQKTGFPISLDHLAYDSLELQGEINKDLIVRQLERKHCCEMPLHQEPGQTGVDWAKSLA